MIETWRRESNEEQPKKALGGLTPAAFAMRLAESANSEPGLQIRPLLKAGGRRPRNAAPLFGSPHIRIATQVEYFKSVLYP